MIVDYSPAKDSIYNEFAKEIIKRIMCNMSPYLNSDG